MRFFEKLFGLLSNSDKNNDYAKAAFVFTTSPEISPSNAIVNTKRKLDFKAKGENDGPSQIIPSESLTSKPKVKPRLHQEA